MLSFGDPHLRVALGVTAATLSLALVARVLATPSQQRSPQQERAAKHLTRQAANAAQMASQDSNTIFALQHVTQALVYLEAAVQLVDAKTLQRLAGTDTQALTEGLRKQQARLVESLHPAS